MQVQAAVVEKRGEPYRIETLDLSDPAADEVIVRVIASGICQTDVHGRDEYYGTPFPCVFGHEGAGIVHRVGAAVTHVAPGDHVIMYSPGCGTCPACTNRLPGYCDSARRIKMNGLLRNGKHPLRRADGSPVHGGFFQQSSFSTYSLCTAGNVLRVAKEVPFEALAAFPCGVNTGAGAVFNALRPKAGESFAVFGAGTVGLAGLMAAAIADCAPIIAVDLHRNRLALARELGATYTVDVNSADPVDTIKQLTGGRGAKYVLEAAGEPKALRQAVDATAVMGTCCLVGSARPKLEVPLEMATVQWGRTLRGCIQGDAPGDEFIPKLIDYYREGRMPVDRLVTAYDFADINRAVDDAVAGRTIKAVLRIGSAQSAIASRSY